MRRETAIVLGGASVVTALTLAVWRPRPAPARDAALPGPGTALGYVSSSACLPCHPGEHASWSRTWHRTMTQRATSGTVLAPFERRGDEVWHDGKKIVMTTGSHREQAYWTAGEGGRLELLSEVWIPQEKALVARSEAFILPPDASMPKVTWSSSCIACHAVAGEPRFEKGRFDTRAAELGVACEACHGPGAAHVAQYRDPVARYAHPKDPKIVQPAKLAPDLANAVCGQCHAYSFPRNEPEWWTSGYSKSFRAGEALGPSRLLLDPSNMAGEDGAPTIDVPASSIFWPDGDARVGGREYNGLMSSKCRATCVSCHSMHEGDPAGQLATDRDCTTSCHVGPRMKTHSQHSADVTCVDCHMPKTSYALLSAVRSHRISIPHETDDDGKPSACHLCHLDEGDWAARVGLAGDAGVRALVADALGHSKNPAFAAPLLDVLASDPYAAVRFIAARSRRRFPGVYPPAPFVLAARDERPVVIAE